MARFLCESVWDKGLVLIPAQYAMVQKFTSSHFRVAPSFLEVHFYDSQPARDCCRSKNLVGYGLCLPSCAYGFCLFVSLKNNFSRLQLAVRQWVSRGNTIKNLRVGKKGYYRALSEVFQCRLALLARWGVPRELSTSQEEPHCVGSRLNLKEPIYSPLERSRGRCLSFTSSPSCAL